MFQGWLDNIEETKKMYFSFSQTWYYSSIFLFNNCLLSTYYVSSTSLGDLYALIGGDVIFAVVTLKVKDEDERRQATCK